jgi:hypothetical protein
MARAAIGFSTHLGWAAAVAVAGTRKKVRVVDRRKVILAAEKVRESHEPYHKAAKVQSDLKKAREIVRRGTRAIEACARAELARLIRDLEEEGCEVVAVAIVQASGREMKFESIVASHAMQHAAEGQLMRDSLAKAAQKRDLPVLGVRKKELLAHAAERMSLRAGQVTAEVDALGDGLGPPWRADQKDAALIAWMGLR